jgi:hypothetical protein
MEQYKRLVSDFLINSFVDDYEFTREYVWHLNSELEQHAIPFRYTYDAFCIELLERFLYVFEKFCNSVGSFQEFCRKFADVVFRTVKEMKWNKLNNATLIAA